MQRFAVPLLFFLSGAAGLVYEVTWARSLGLVLGASHLAVTIVLAVYMGGQALGSSLLGPLADRSPSPLRLYALLEAGIAVTALAFLALMRVYPAIYPPIARVAEGSTAWVTGVRIAFAAVALIVPTTLMGGTLPVLTRLAAGRPGGVAQHLSHLYAVNTAGAVAGTLAGGFLLLPGLGVTRTLLVAAGLSVLVGAVAFLLEGKLAAPVTGADTVSAPASPGGPDLVARLTVLGIGISGFCALGYEVLWTRMLTLVVGTSVYSFAVMLVAFLAGIGTGSRAFALLQRRLEGKRRAALAFGACQVLIALSALAVTVLMRDLPTLSGRVRELLVWRDASEFAGRLVSSMGVGVAFLFVPAFFMGLAFPLAGAVWAGAQRQVGAAVGRLLTANTVGAILGAVVSGFFLIYAFGIERSLQLLMVVNATAGLAVAAALLSPRLVLVALAGGALALAARAGLPDWGRVWDRKYFATYVNNARSADTPEMARLRIGELEVLYYREGVNETVSVVRSRGGEQSFIVNGRPEASTALIDVQLQRALGHVPMLLHPSPRRVFVLGTGTAMTLGATAIHPEAERVVLAEIEEGVLGVARTFARWNHGVLDSPKLRVVIDDGRSYLATTHETFDVITADPIHPWSGGAGYLYTVEYFRTVAAHLAPGGVASQWLPLYELSTDDVRTVLRSFSAAFPHVYVWLTFYDAVLVGANEPVAIDPAALERRMAQAGVGADLAPVQMGTAEDLLSFFLMGTVGARAFGAGAALNTDDSVVLEFSAPASQGVVGLDGLNVGALYEARESILPYLTLAPDEAGRKAQAAWAGRLLESGRRFAGPHVRFLLGERGGPEVDGPLADLERRAPGYGPLRFLRGEQEFWRRTDPDLVRTLELPVRTARGPGMLRLAAVRQYLGRSRVLVSIVDNARREIYGQRYLDGEYEALEGEVQRFAAGALEALEATARRAAPPGGLPDEATLLPALRQEAMRVVGRIEDGP